MNKQKLIEHHGKTLNIIEKKAEDSAFFKQPVIPPRHKHMPNLYWSYRKQSDKIWSTKHG
jgi:hypothetical protein